MSELFGVISSGTSDVFGVVSSELKIYANVIATGPKGDKGEKGEKGDTPTSLPASGIIEDENKVFLTSLDKQNLLDSLTKENYIHNQIMASSVWTINHTLNKFPSINIVDSAGSLVIGDVAYTSLSQIVVSFTAPFSGIAYLN